MKKKLIRSFSICTLVLVGGCLPLAARAQNEANSVPRASAQTPNSVPVKLPTRQALLGELSALQVQIERLEGADRPTTKAGKLLKDVADFKIRLQGNLGKADTDAQKNRSIVDGFKQDFIALTRPPSSALTEDADGARAVDNSANTAMKPVSPKEMPTELEAESWIWFILKWVAFILAAGLVVGGIIWAILFLRRARERERNEIRAGFSDLKNRNNGFNQKLEELGKIITNLSQQVAQQKSEIGKLRQGLSDSPSPSYAPPPPPVASVPKEPPRFPAAVDDYIGKVGAGGTAVKYDYKEGMLVADSGNEGGLLIVQDEGRSYLIPSFGFFQTKSDYTNYFERFFSCARPMGGSVWIRQPATVNQVAGGWQMDVPGELEIR